VDHPVMTTRSSDGLRNSLADTREPGRELVSSERVWSGPIFAVDADQVRLGPGQEPVARQVVVHHDAVAVVPVRRAAGGPGPGPPGGRRASTSGTGPRPP